MVHSVQSVHLYCTDTNISPNGPKRDSTWSTHLGFHWVRSRRFSNLRYVWRKPYTYHELRLALSPNGLKQASTWALSPRSIIRCVQNDFWANGTFGAKPCTHITPTLSPNGSKRDSTWPTRLGFPSGAFKTISEPIVRLAQTVHLSYVKISTISKRTQTSFHLSLVTKEYHLVRPKWFLSQRYIWCKPCSYIAPALTLSPNEPKRVSTWPTHLGLPSAAFKIIFEPMVHLAQTAHLSYVKTSTISKRTQTSFHLSLVT
jgi:hypothetical protein